MRPLSRVLIRMEPLISWFIEHWTDFPLSTGDLLWPFALYVHPQSLFKGMLESAGVSLRIIPFSVL